MSKSLFNRTIAIPQDHGSWVFILGPLLIGLFAGKTFTPASAWLILASMAAFFIRQPATIAVKALAGHRPRTDLPPALFWAALYGFIALTALVGIILTGHARVLLLAIPALPILAWHLFLVSRHAERKQAGLEVVATGALALAAPAAYWLGTGVYSPLAWALWVLTWMQSAASIVHAYLRLQQRTLPALPPRSHLWKMGRRALLYTSFNLTVALLTSLSGLIPFFVFIPFLLQWLETLWGITHPAIAYKPTRIGLRQLFVSSLFIVLFIITWR